MRPLLLVLLACWFATPLLAQGVDPDAQAKRIVESPPYQGYRVERRATPEESSREWDGQQGGASGQGDGQSGYRREGRLSPPKRSTRPERPSGGGPDVNAPDFSGLSWLGGVMQVIVWIVIGLAAVLALFFVVKALLGLKLQRRKKAAKSKVERKKTEPSADAQPDAAPDVPEEVFADALELAMRDYDAALKAEDWSRAALLAYRMFWLRAGWSGCVENTDVRTWRDALRLVRQLETRQRVRDLLRLVERVRYGEHRPDGAEFKQWRAELDLLKPEEALK